MKHLRTLALVLGASAALFTAQAQQTATPSRTPDGEVTDEIVRLEAFEVRELKSFSDQAIPGETPVSFTELTKETITAELGSRDIPLVLNSTPSVFASTDSGGAGDARVNVRGFNQRNVSILINGVPTNDIENGWLYWSNWDGLGNVTSTIQIQRGMSNVTLPTPSIGGTMNIITDPASARRGGSIQLEIGNDDFFKQTFVYNTGLIADRFAATIGVVNKQGDGYVRGTWAEGQGYYVGASFRINERNRIDVFGIAAPQRHGQRTFASNIAAYNAEFARRLGYTEEQIFSTASGADAGALRQGPVDAGYDYNPNHGPVNPAYDGLQFYWGGLHRRQERAFLNERENYFNKPQVNLNWYSTISDRLQWNSVFYYSGGRGGGSGTLNNGSSSAAFARFPNTYPLFGSNINWDGTIASNAGAVDVRGNPKTPGQSLGILRNSVNNQDQFGIVSKLSYELNDEFKLTTGADWRTAEIDHFREVRDLLGGDYYLPTEAQASDFWAEGTDTRLGLGDKVDYFNTNTVDWLGLFVQGQFRRGPVNAFAVYGYSVIDYTYVDHFRDAGNGTAYRLDAPTLDGHQIKGGLQYAFNDQWSVYGNAGWVSKVPVFDGVINDVTGVLLEPENEKFSSFETGVRFENPDRTFNVSAGLYHTRWRDRTIATVDETANDEGEINTIVTYQRGVNSNYSGLEIESAWQPDRRIRFDLAASFGNWYYTSDAPFESFNVTTGQPVSTDDMLRIQSLKVGDMPQSQVAYAVSVFPVRGLSIKFQGRWYDRYYADYDPATRTDPNDRAQPWEIPSYTIYDLHVSYRLPLRSDRYNISVFAHLFNVFDKLYVSDATDESQFEGVGTNLAAPHSAQRAEVFLGQPFAFNTGVKFEF